MNDQNSSIKQKKINKKMEEQLNFFSNKNATVIILKCTIRKVKQIKRIFEVDIQFNTQINKVVNQFKEWIVTNYKHNKYRS